MQKPTGLIRHFQKIHSAMLAIVVLLSFQVGAVFSQTSGEEKCNSTNPNSLRITVISRRETIESDSMQEGINLACKESQSKVPVAINYNYYDSSREGFEKISEIIQQETADVIIGPTESEVYADLIAYLDFEKVRPIPIVSPIVTLRSGNKADGWLFRTNLDAELRTQAIYDHFSNLGIENFALLYADRKFGEISEAAFRKELSPIQENKFRSYRFQDTDSARQWAKQVIEQQPEAIGIIGGRDEVKYIVPLISKHGVKWNAYNPYIFTIVDTRSIPNPNIHFLSVGKDGSISEGKVHDEVHDLSYDTTNLILDIANNITTKQRTPRTEDWSEKFRQRLIGTLSGAQNRTTTHTTMEFQGLRNRTAPKVMKLKGDNVIILSQPKITWYTPLQNWLEVRKRRFGPAPIINIALISLIVIALSVLDLRRSHRIEGKDILAIPFLSLIGLNTATAIVIFVIMAEKSVLAWDSLLGALLVALGYAGLLKTTIFESEQGQTYGAKKYYDMLVLTIYDKIRKQQFENEGAVINYIAYKNSTAYLKDRLLESYDFARDDTRKKILVDRLEEALEAEQSTIGKRKVLAKSVLNEISWPQLADMRIIPLNKKKEDIVNPVPMLDRMVEYCTRKNSPTVQQAIQRVNEALEETDLNDEFESDLEAAGTHCSKLMVCFRWLMLLKSHDEKTFIELGWLPNPEGKNDSQEEVEPQPNRRKHTRISIGEAAQVLPIELHALVTDISLDGARLLISKEDSDALDLTESQSISISGSITVEQASFSVENKNCNDQGDLEIGISWLELQQINKQSLDGFLAEKLSQMEYVQ